MVKEEKEKQLTAEGTLAPQFGSDTTTMVKGKFDIRLLSKIGPLDVIWLGYFMNLPDEEGGEFARMFCENYLYLSNSEEGWRMNKMNQAIAGSKGATAVGALMKKPGIVARNITDRGWKKRAEEEGKTVVE